MAKLKMQEYELVGYRKVNFTGNNGKPVNGCTVFLFPVEKPEDIVGTACYSQYIDYRTAAYEPNLRDIVIPKYNQYGNVFDFEVNYVGT